jgi:poly-gamma-glutamate capsule biosynthesis protein CapA/YwtB (metallophosphatase superfamily)
MGASMELPPTRSPTRPTLRIFLCGDVMTGRGIDQVLPHPSDPLLHEEYVDSALHYVRFAEQVNGPIPRNVAPSYVWDAAVDEFNRARPDVRIINLETSITRSDDYAPKGINYRMSPENAHCLAAAGVDCCVLANNHVLDWGHVGLLDTLATLAHLKIRTTGAGRNLAQASAPAMLKVPGKGRVLVFSLAVVTSGTPRSWAATKEAAGVNLLTELSDTDAARIADQVGRLRQPSDVMIVSLHWGPNWGYEISDEERRFAHALIDRADVSIVHGHSSHHPKAIEVYRNRLILYGCGDFLNDYEGIRGYEEFRDDLGLMYFADISPSTAELSALRIVPLQIRQFRLVRPSMQDVDWVRQLLDLESQRFGTRVALTPGGRLALSWPTGSKPTALDKIDTPVWRQDES